MARQLGTSGARTRARAGARLGELLLLAQQRDRRADRREACHSRGLLPVKRGPLAVPSRRARAARFGVGAFSIATVHGGDASEPGDPGIQLATTADVLCGPIEALYTYDNIDG